eukprot:1154418-Pelagomonas_calceolata.AAC.5
MRTLASGWGACHARKAWADGRIYRRQQVVLQKQLHEQRATGGEAVQSRRRRVHPCRRMADYLPDPH